VRENPEAKTKQKPTPHETTDAHSAKRKMNHESPLIPQGSLLEQKNKSRSRVKTAFFCVLAVHVLAILTALIAQGCKREQSQVPPEPTTPVPTFDTNALPPAATNAVPEIVSTNAIPPVVVPPVVPPATAQTHVVVKGDSFYSIAKKYGTTIKAVAEANPGVDPKKLQPGKTLNIPAPAALPAGGAAAPVPNAEAGPGGQTYTVVSRDTLSKIAVKFGTTVKALRSANNLTTDRIKVNDKLKIPVKAAAPAAPEPAPASPPVTAPATTPPVR
jgi:LysM repeat protein